MIARYRFYVSVLALALVFAGCGDDSVDADQNQNNENGDEYVPPLEDLDTLMAGAPKNDEIPGMSKADAVYPAQHTELIELQSPVKSQGARGVCSIFSTVALMEHLYIKEGTIENPDFSEQYVQWSAKFEVGSFPNTGGSSARSNLQAISQYGAVEEDVWPYEPNGWDSSDDPECEGDSKPTRCYTNGEPPAEAEQAQKWKLPSGRWVSTRPDDIKHVIHDREMAVVVGLTFFYQSWNHGGSPLPTSKEFSRKGYVPYPNEVDKEKSLENRAGHSILLVGWDDDLEVHRLDEEGEPMYDDNGDPVIDKGFFIFKNSWGTGSFGTDNPFPNGYGYISMDYVEEYGSAYMSDIPTVETPEEICGDGIDNSGNDLIDCEDSACDGHPTCEETSDTASYTNDQSTPIPDNDTNGIASQIEVTDSGPLASISVNVDITHTYRGDVSVILESPSGDIAILKETGSDSEDNIVETFVVDEFEGLEASGTWTLYVSDEARYDEGTLNEWGMELAF
jgi:hypothetical protein